MSTKSTPKADALRALREREANELAPVQSPLRQRLVGAASSTATNIDMAIGEEMLSEIMQESTSQVTSLIHGLNS